MFNVKITQFVLPETINIMFDDMYKLPYTAMLEAGFRLETEYLTTNQVSVTVTRGDVDVDHVVVNGSVSAVEGAIRSLLRREAWTCSRSV